MTKDQKDQKATQIDREQQMVRDLDRLKDRMRDCVKCPRTVRDKLTEYFEELGNQETADSVKTIYGTEFHVLVNLARDFVLYWHESEKA